MKNQIFARLKILISDPKELCKYLVRVDIDSIVINYHGIAKDLADDLIHLSLPETECTVREYLDRIVHITDTLMRQMNYDDASGFCGIIANITQKRYTTFVKFVEGLR